MVHVSPKQELLNKLKMALQFSIVAETMMNSTSTLDDDLDDSDDNDYGDEYDYDDNYAFSRALAIAYLAVQSDRYSVDRRIMPRRRDTILDRLDHYAEHNHKLYRGLVRMTPQAFEDLTLRLSSTDVFKETRIYRRVQMQIAVGLYCLGRSGNGGGVRDAAFACGCSWGSVHLWTEKTIRALYEINTEVVTFATEDKRAKASAWVKRKSGVEEWGRGWLVADGTHINLAWKPAMNAREHYSYKGDYTFNVALVFLPHSLRIVESVVGHPGSSHDSHVWASGQGIVAKPHLHLDEGEFVWVDSGFGYSSYSVSPFGNTFANQSRDIRFFNFSMSRIRVRAEHGIAYLKNRFQCLMGYRGNLYREEDHEKAAYAIQACIIAHTFASRYDRPEDVAEYLLELYSPEVVEDVTAELSSYQQATESARVQRRDNQLQYEEELAQATQGMSQRQLANFRADGAHALREEMITALFSSLSRRFEDTTAASRRRGRTEAGLEADQVREARRNEVRRAQRSQQARRSRSQQAQ
ncbi:uncharacterized protein UTRI_10393 [Ustilago trichophora]|uniref:DDE Tnp4 domain-containing protein n=1 Tax=Ustilago trichophora TaxID=86804 RepID=A0A5C3ECG3_9BASI|nr:uncharacterized protein UTRI_10393 [Ustilago trichophora]